jgi:hypothetical protein
MYLSNERDKGKSADEEEMRRVGDAIGRAKFRGPVTDGVRGTEPGKVRA